MYSPPELKLSSTLSASKASPLDVMPRTLAGSGVAIRGFFLRSCLAPGFQSFAMGPFSTPTIRAFCDTTNLNLKDDAAHLKQAGPVYLNQMLAASAIGINLARLMGSPYLRSTVGQLAYFSSSPIGHLAYRGRDIAHFNV